MHAQAGGNDNTSGSGETGRRTILRGWRSQGVGVQVPPPAQKP